MKHYINKHMFNTPVFEGDKLEASTDVLRALSHPLRLQLVSFIQTSNWVTVQTIYQTLGIEQSLTSQHLRILRRADLVHTQRDGKHVKYHLNVDRYNQVSSALSNFLGRETQFA